MRCQQADDLGDNDGALEGAVLALVIFRGGLSVAERIEEYRRTNRLSPEVDVPADAVQASGSGLDPQISIANARLQAPRVAAERHLDLDDVLGLVDAHTEPRPLGILGDPGVNVLELNLALDRAG